jgi:catalase
VDPRTPQTTAPQDALRSMYDILGRPPACRAGHAKGMFCAGVFIPSKEAAELTEAAHLQDVPVEVTVRLSRVTGNPDAHDGDNGRCGMATRFHLPDGSDTDLIAISLDRFTNRCPQDFVKMNYACFTPGDGKVKRGFKTALFLLRHRETLRPMMAAKRKKPVPSYANCRFNSINAFVWTKDGARCFVRYSWLPDDGERSIAKEEALERPPDYLQQDVAQRLGSEPPSPMRFRLQVQLAARADEAKGHVVDPVRVWPARPNRILPAGLTTERPRFLTAGLLELTRLAEGPATRHEAVGFNPLNLTRGIEASEDEILNFRHAVYELASAERLRPVPAPGPFQSQ